MLNFSLTHSSISYVSSSFLDGTELTILDISDI